MAKVNSFSKILCCDVIFKIKYPSAESEDHHSYPYPYICQVRLLGSDSNRIRTHNDLVGKWALNHSKHSKHAPNWPNDWAELWLLYGAFNCMSLGSVLCYSPLQNYWFLDKISSRYLYKIILCNKNNLRYLA